MFYVNKSVSFRLTGISIAAIAAMTLTACSGAANATEEPYLINSVAEDGADNTNLDLSSSIGWTPDQELPEPGTFFNLPDTFGQVLTHLGSYDTGFRSEDGGVGEIVVFNAANQSMYIVNEITLSIDIVSLADLAANPNNELTLTKRVDIAEMGQAHGFEVSDVTNVAINSRLGVAALSVQSAHWQDNGTIVFMDFDGNYVTHVPAGVQPDMIAVSPDGNFVLTANEGEPRSAFTDGDTFGVFFGEGSHGSNADTTNEWDFSYDPKGGVTVVDLSDISSIAELRNLSENQVEHFDFTVWDSRLEELVSNEVIIKAGNLPSRDLEPEYIVFSSDGRTAFVVLQENNAIAHFDLASRAFTGIYGIGFIDHSQPGNEINLSSEHIDIRAEANVFGVPQPDGIAAIEINGVQYILTANEGDGREWDFYDGDETGAENRARYRNFRRTEVNGAQEVENLVNELHYVLNERLDDVFLFGSRSFSIIRADDNHMVFDSGSDFERITAETFPTIFNSHHRENAFGTRSPRKGPEPESVQALQIGDRYFAFIGLERIGGLMMYDITNPAEAFFVDYLNIRNPQIDGLDAGDLGAEGIYAIAASLSPTGRPIILVANEVSGSISIIEINVAALASEN